MVQDIREIADGLRNIRCCRKKCQVFEILKADNLEGIVRDLEPATVCKLLELLQMEKSTKAKTRACKKASGASYGRNLVKNPSGELGFEHWTIKGHGMVVEEEPFGFGEYAQECKKFPRSFTSSFGWSSKTTQIDLVKEGFTRTDLDHVQPEIRVSEWFVGRLDCGSKYKFTARLLGEDQEVLDQFHFENHWPGWTRPEWKQVEHVFRNYSKGVQIVELKSSGKDINSWAGHYGAKMAEATVVVEFPASFDRNLIPNPSGELGFESWTVDSNGDGMIIESPVDFKYKGIDKFDSCFTTSYEWCEKSICIDLWEKGFSSKYLDTLQPKIEVYEWVAQRYDCSAVYEITVRLLDEDKQELEVFQDIRKWDQWELPEWEKVKHVFRGYPKGVRYVEMKSRGKDGLWWAGHYGAKMAEASIVVKSNPSR